VTAPTGTTSYAYDPVGNRSSRTRTGTTTISYTYDRADRIKTVVQGSSTTYTVNANGNLTARGNDDFTYDQANRLKTAVVGGVTSSYGYDGDGKRASQTVGGTTTRSVYDVGGGLPVLLDDGTRKYVWGLGLAYAVSGSSIEVYHTDGLGSVRALTNGSGALVQTQATDEFGVPTGSLGSSGQPFGYTGEQRDATGLVYLRARMYDPATGRFVQRDPWAGATTAPISLHRYAYVANNPVNAVDPDGLDPWKISQVLRDSGYDNRCLIRNQDGSGYLFSLRCSNPILLALLWQIYQTPFGPKIISGVHFATTDGGDDASDTGNNDSGSKRPTRHVIDHDDLAKQLGYRKISSRSHGQPIYQRGNRFITPDVDSHSGGVWKMANSPDNLRSKQTRMGTYDAKLKRIGD
jgi:RHS repeat-associated protein